MPNGLAPKATNLSAFLTSDPNANLLGYNSFHIFKFFSTCLEYIPAGTCEESAILSRYPTNDSLNISFIFYIFESKLRKNPFLKFLKQIPI